MKLKGWPLPLSKGKALANLNRLILVGRLITDPEVRNTAGGVLMAKFKLEVAPAQGLSLTQPMQRESDFFDVIAWDRLADNCGQRLTKGTLVLVEGRTQIRSFEDQTGQRRWVTEVVAREVLLLSGNAQKPSAAPVRQGTADQELIDDLPF